MKLLAAIFSIITLLILSLALLNNTDYENKANNSITDIKIALPAVLPKKLLVAEQKWQTLLAKKDIDTNTAKPKDDTSEFKNALKVGDKSYILLGVFNNDESLFVLLKNNESKVLKLALGDNVTGNFALTEINNTTIVFSDNNERVEYKLFEPKNYVKN